MNASNWPLVIVESPFAGDMEANAEYLKKCCLDCLSRGEVPFASHGFFPHFLNELDFQHRELGLTAGYAFWFAATKIVFYKDCGMSAGMQRAFERANQMKIPIEFRSLTGEQHGQPGNSEPLPGDVPTERADSIAAGRIARDYAVGDWQKWPEATDPIRPDHPPAKDRKQES